MFVHRFIWVLLVTVLAGSIWSARPSRGAGAESRHVVRAGETLWSIASGHYGGDVREGVWRLEQRNGLSGAPLQPGTVLYLP